LVLLVVHEVDLSRVEAKLTAELAAEKAELSTSPELAEQIQRYKQDRSRLEQVINTVEHVSSHDFSALDFLSAVREPMQGAMDIEAVRLRRGKLLIWVLADETAVVARYAERLAQQPGISRIEIKPSRDPEVFDGFLVGGRWEGRE
jgi:hypothetical protein